MEFSSELLFFLSALGAFNGFLLGIYFSFFKKPKHVSNFFLGGFLICLSIRIGKSVIFYFHDDLAFGYLQFGLTACFFIGPFLYFYLKSIYTDDRNIVKKWKWNLLVLLPIILFINFRYPFEHNIDLWRPYIIYFIYLIWIGYTLLAIPFIWKLVSSYLENKSLSIQGQWDLSIFIGNILIWAAFTFCGFTSYILGALLFSFMLYLLILVLVFRNKLDFSVEHEKYKGKKIQDEQAQKLLERANTYMTQSEKYKDPNIKISEIASALNILPHTLSQILNDNLGKNFSQYLNEFRIESAKKMILEKENLTLKAIAYDCGFNSKSTFYNSFKKITGSTPKSFKNQS